MIWDERDVFVAKQAVLTKRVAWQRWWRKVVYNLYSLFFQFGKSSLNLLDFFCILWDFTIKNTIRENSGIQMEKMCENL